MELKHINREISQLATMEATNYISERGLEKLKEFRYLRGLHEEKVKKLTIPNVSQQRELLKAFGGYLANEYPNSKPIYLEDIELFLNSL